MSVIYLLTAVKWWSISGHYETWSSKLEVTSLLCACMCQKDISVNDFTLYWCKYDLLWPIKYITQNLLKSSSHSSRGHFYLPSPYIHISFAGPFLLFWLTLMSIEVRPTNVQESKSSCGPLTGISLSAQTCSLNCPHKTGKINFGGLWN